MIQVCRCSNIYIQGPFILKIKGKSQVYLYFFLDKLLVSYLIMQHYIYNDDGIYCWDISVGDYNYCAILAQGWVRKVYLNNNQVIIFCFLTLLFIIYCEGARVTERLRKLFVNTISTVWYNRTSNEIAITMLYE